MDDETPRASSAASNRTGSALDTRWPDDVQELAFELWGWYCNRKCTLVRERLLAHDPPVDVPVRTLQRWALDWPQEYARRLAALAPDMTVQVAGNLFRGALDGSFALAELQTRAANGELVDGRLMASLTRAVEMAVDRLGFSPLGRSAGPKLAAEVAIVALPDFAAMTPEERRAWELERRETLRADLRPKTR